MNFNDSQQFTKIDILLNENGGSNITKVTHDSPIVLIKGKHMIISTDNGDSWTHTIYKLKNIRVFKTYK
jgi:hypothetical protein